LYKLNKVIKEVSIFSKASKNELALLVANSYVKSYEKNKLLTYEKEKSSEILFLIDGGLEAYKLDKNQNEILLYYIQIGSLISELTSLEQNEIKYFSNMKFTHDSLILAINYRVFKQICLKNNGIIFNLLQEVSKQNQKLHLMIDREILFCASAKIAFMLINKLDVFNKLKRSEIALLLHIQPETLSRTLKKFSTSKLICIAKGKISIKNEALLSTYID